MASSLDLNAGRYLMLGGGDGIRPLAWRRPSSATLRPDRSTWRTVGPYGGSEARTSRRASKLSEDAALELKFMAV